jgi:hypothetical protein
LKAGQGPSSFGEFQVFQRQQETIQVTIINHQHQIELLQYQVQQLQHPSAQLTLGITIQQRPIQLQYLELLAHQQDQHLALSTLYHSVALNLMELLRQQQQESQQTNHRQLIELAMQKQSMLTPTLQPGSFVSPIDQQLLGFRGQANKPMDRSKRQGSDIS